MDKPPILGYKALTEPQINVVNLVKDIANKVGNITDMLEDSDICDPFWLDVGKTDLQKGFMSIIRSITQPDGF
jgi:hypothetical protein